VIPVNARDLLMTVRVMNDLPRLLQARREHLGLSLRDVAREVDLSHSTVTRLASGKDVSLETAVVIVRWLAWA
jgi:transcriptional regulator with XRE-family HTH domain